MPRVVATSSTALRTRRRAPARGRLWPRLALAGGSLIAVAIVFGLVYAGSPDRLAGGTTIDGVDVGGLTSTDARKLLERRARQLADVPVTFTAAGKQFKLEPRTFGVRVDWARAVAQAQQQGSGFGVVRGYRRLGLELFPADVVPQTRAYDAAITYELGQLGKQVDSPHREARLVRRGLHITIAPGATGHVLDRAAARRLIVDSLASLSRAPVALPVKSDPPTVTVASLGAAQQNASRVIAAPITLTVGKTRLRIPRWRLATILKLPADANTPLAFAGPAADAYFAQLERAVDSAPKDADFAIGAGGTVRVVPGAAGVSLDIPTSAARMLAAAERTTNRVAALAVAEQQPQRTTAQAEAMGITGTVGTYETIYGGDPNRIHNVQLVAHLVDRTLIAPGDTFSFNGTTGERTAAKGFLEAPVIINGELQNGLGGGICQVSTTVFNAAYEAGLPITARTNHALYISHYPLGRDATVNYPDIDLKFVNDTSRWLLLRTWVGSSSLTVTLYGTPQNRRVESIASPLRVVGPPPVSKTVDATLKPGETVVDDPGVPAQSTSVERKVYNPNGTLRSDATWTSSYRAEPRVIRVGPKAKPKQPKSATQAGSKTSEPQGKTTTSPVTPPAATTTPPTG